MPVTYVLIRWLISRRPHPILFPPAPTPKQREDSAVSALSQSLNDEVQVAQAIHTQSQPSTELPQSAFIHSADYYPITSRQMKQSWRSLRRLIREGPLVELDVEATVKQIGQVGMLLAPTMRARRVNRNQLLLLIDREGSMVPFHGLSDRLTKTAQQGGRLASANIYYFHNYPSEYLYRDCYHQEADTMDDVLSRLQPERTSVLIFSDAGAARGGFSPERVALTAHFLARLQQKLRYVAWLNPMPQARWTGTAGEIAKQVPMFELTRQGLDRSIDLLRGKSVSQTFYSASSYSKGA